MARSSPVPSRALIPRHAAAVEAAAARIFPTTSTPGATEAGAVGSAVFPTMAGYAATPTIGALAYRTSDYIQRSRELFA